MFSNSCKQPPFQGAAVCDMTSYHVGISVVSSVGLRVVACLVALLGFLSVGVFAETGDSLGKIIVFQAGTSAQVQHSVVTQSGSQLLNILPIINGVGIRLPIQNTEQALALLQADPSVTGIYDDLQVSGQDGGGDNIIVITPAAPPPQEIYSWGL